MGKNNGQKATIIMSGSSSARELIGIVRHALTRIEELLVEDAENTVPLTGTALERSMVGCRVRVVRYGPHYQLIGRIVSQRGTQFWNIESEGGGNHVFYMKESGFVVIDN